VVGYRTPDVGVYVAGDREDDNTADVPDSDSHTRHRSVTFESFDSGRELSWSLGERHCAGVVTDEGHDACDVPDAPYCEHHQSTWVCARCTGTCLKDEMDCHDDHAVYLAAFAPDQFKVGVTKLWRLETRLREQGADRAAHVRTVDNGRIAREIESGLAAEIPDRVRVPKKIAGLDRAVDPAAWERLLAEFDPIETYDFDYGLSLSEQPVAETLASGTVRGAKGRVVVIENGGTSYAVDLRDLVGYELVPEATDRQLQSSLGAFG
jgi:hypothetical protein